MSHITLDVGLVVAAERYGSAHSHGILNMLHDYRGWVDLANRPDISEYAASRCAVVAEEKAVKLRRALLTNYLADTAERGGNRG